MRISIEEIREYIKEFIDTTDKFNESYNKCLQLLNNETRKIFDELMFDKIDKKNQQLKTKYVSLTDDDFGEDIEIKSFNSNCTRYIMYSKINQSLLYIHRFNNYITGFLHLLEQGLIFNKESYEIIDNFIADIKSWEYNESNNNDELEHIITKFIKLYDDYLSARLILTSSVYDTGLSEFSSKVHAHELYKIAKKLECSKLSKENAEKCFYIYNIICEWYECLILMSNYTDTMLSRYYYHYNLDKYLLKKDN